ncbi:MAG: hypothetical protein WBO10_03540 [Pyrinomonadaceae bacterium]
MPEWLSGYLTLETLVPVGTVGVVLFLDFIFRRVAYNRSDPLSFSLLGFSFLLVVTDVSLKVIEIFDKRKDPNYSGADDIILVLIAFAYVLSTIVIFYLAKIAHVAFQNEQQKLIHNYLENLRNTNPTGNGVWGALEALGKNMIEPDLYENNPAKREKRIEFLERVRDLAGVTINPEEEQGNLIVGKGPARRWARVTYAFTFVFALAVTLYFFAERNSAH